MNQSFRKYKIILFCFGLICLISAIWISIFEKDTNLLTAITIPFDWLGLGLRNLSLYGTVGNVTAWIIYVLIGMVPLAFPFVRLLHKKKFIIADGICVITSMYTFFYLFLLVNPSLVANFFNPVMQNVAQVEKTTLFILFASFICSVIVLYVLQEDTDKKVLANIRCMVVLFACFGIFTICFSGLHNTLVSFSTIQKEGEGFFTDMLSVSNILPTKNAFIDYFIIITRYIAEALPTLFLLSIVSPVLELLYNMDEDFYSHENVQILKMIVKRTKMAIMFFVLCSLGFNLLQFLLARYATDIQMNAVIPLPHLMIAFVMLFLTKYFAQSTKLHDENQQFV